MVPTILLAMMMATGEAVPQPDAPTAGAEVPAPTKLYSHPLQYPPLARQRRVQGVVVLEVTVDEEGRPAEVKVLRGLSLLDGAAIDAIKASRYAPTTVDGVRRRVQFTEYVPFYISDRERLRAAATLAQDRRRAASMRTWAISDLLQIPAKYRQQVSAALSGAANDPDPTVADAAKQALERLATR